MIIIKINTLTITLIKNVFAKVMKDCLKERIKNMENPEEYIKVNLKHA